MIWLLLLFISISIVLCVLLYRSFKIISEYEDVTSVLIDQTEDTRKKINQLYIDINYIDDQGLFEKDDYVGTIFTGIKELLQKYNDEI